MRYSLSASVALCGLFALSALFPATGRAQVNGVPASVTSPGFGGRPVNGARPSVTSLGPNGYAPNSRVTFSTSPSPSGRDHPHPHPHHYVEYAPPLIYAVPLPYAVDISDTDEYANANADDRDANYQGGPTIFDRRGSGPDSYIPPVKDVPTPHASQPGDAASPEPPQEPTILVFKDGHTLEVGNYAIVGATLFDLTPGHTRRIALADLDLDATRKQNDNRGVTFQLPTPPQAN